MKEVFDERIRTILEGAGAEQGKLFLTGDKRTYGLYAKLLSRSDEGKLPDYAPNFREALATGKVYKGTRKQDKPFHWINLTAYILSQNNVTIANGWEADDDIAMEYVRRDGEAIICTRDKDLRMVPGLHYGWECGKQPEFGPVEYDSVGKIELVRSKSTNKIRGGGWAFFCSQLLTGDVVDNIGGARGIGPVRAYDLLQNCTSEHEYFSAVVRTYQDNYGSSWLETLTEQCSLLWIIRERNEDGSLKHFNIEEWL